MSNEKDLNIKIMDNSISINGTTYDPGELSNLITTTTTSASSEYSFPILQYEPYQSHWYPIKSNTNYYTQISNDELTNIKLAIINSNMSDEMKLKAIKTITNNLLNSVQVTDTLNINSTEPINITYGTSSVIV